MRAAAFLPIFLMTSTLWFSIGVTAAPSFSQDLDAAFRLILEARAMARTGKHDEALRALQQSATLADEAGNRLAAAVAFNNMADIYHREGNNAEALAAARQAFHRFRDLENLEGMSVARQTMETIAPGSSEVTEAQNPSREHLIRQAIERVRNRVLAKHEDNVKSADSDNPEYRDYLAQVKNSIVGAWKDPEVSSAMREEGKIGVQFTIVRDGSVEDLRILQPSNYLPLNIEAIRAVKTAAPFPPIPERLGFARIHIEFTFNYILPGPTGSADKNR